MERRKRPYRKISNNVSRYSPCQEVKVTYTTPSIAPVCGLDLVTCFQERWNMQRGKTVTLQWRNLADSTLTNRSRSTSPVRSHDKGMDPLIKYVTVAALLLVVLGMLEKCCLFKGISTY